METCRDSFQACAARTEPKAEVCGPDTENNVPVNDEAGQAHQEYKKKTHKENLRMETCRDSFQACAARREPKAEVCGPDTEDTVPVNDEAGQAHQLDTKQECKKITNKENLQMETPRDRYQACSTTDNIGRKWKGSRALKQGFQYLKQVMNPI